jgi:hypothetical protein
MTGAVFSRHAELVRVILQGLPAFLWWKVQQTRKTLQFLLYYLSMHVLSPPSRAFCTFLVARNRSLPPTTLDLGHPVVCQIVSVFGACGH